MLEKRRVCGPVRALLAVTELELLAASLWLIPPQLKKSAPSIQGGFPSPPLSLPRLSLSR